MNGFGYDTQYDRDHIDASDTLQHEYHMAAMRAFARANVNLVSHDIFTTLDQAVKHTMNGCSLGMAVRYRWEDDYEQRYIFPLYGMSPAQLEKAIGLLLAHNPIEEALRDG